MFKVATLARSVRPRRPTRAPVHRVKTTASARCCQTMPATRVFAWVSIAFYSFFLFLFLFRFKLLKKYPIVCVVSCVPITGGYSGSQCQIVASNPCASAPCQNNGVCSLTNSGTAYQCFCTAGYSGTNCATSTTSPCTSAPCYNNGICSPLSNNNGYSCICLCENHSMFFVYFLHRASILMSNAKRICWLVTIAGYYGTQCQYQSSAAPCQSSPCLNNGVCNALSTGGYSCICTPSFTGSNCGITIAVACLSAPCQNNGLCTNLPNNLGYSCTCTSKTSLLT